MQKLRLLCQVFPPSQSGLTGEQHDLLFHSCLGGTSGRKSNPATRLSTWRAWFDQTADGREMWRLLKIAVDDATPPSTSNQWQQPRTPAHAPWNTAWARTPSDWHDEPDSLAPSLRLLPEMQRLQLFGRQASQLKQLPWLDMAREIAEGACSAASSTFLSRCSLTVPELSQHIENWRANNDLVDAVIGWKG